MTSSLTTPQLPAELLAGGMSVAITDRQMHPGFLAHRHSSEERSASNGYETIPAHQVTYPSQGLAVAGLRTFGLTEQGGPARVQLHAELDGRWLLTLSAREEDIRTMRLVTHSEPLPADRPTREA